MPRNRIEAARLYDIAARNGIDGAKLNLGALFYNGDGIIRDQERARQLFVEAAKSNEPSIRSQAELISNRLTHLRTLSESTDRK